MKQRKAMSNDRYQGIRKALADMDAAAEARNGLAWRDAHARFVVHVAPDTVQALLEERDELREALAELITWIPSGDTYLRLGFDPKAPMQALEEAKKALSKENRNG